MILPLGSSLIDVTNMNNIDKITCKNCKKVFTLSANGLHDNGKFICRKCLDPIFGLEHHHLHEYQLIHLGFPEEQAQLYINTIKICQNDYLVELRNRKYKRKQAKSQKMIDEIRKKKLNNE